MLRIHQPYIKTSKYRSRYTFALASIGVLLLGSLVVINSFSVDTKVYAAEDTRTLSDISTMQEMTQQICSNSEELETNTLKDTRDTNSYSVVKLQDGNCWMQQNLALAGGTKITSADSDVKSDWTLPTSATMSWSTGNTAVQMKNGVSGMTVNSSYPGNNKGWQSNYGNYYSWCAATAESCKLNRTGNSITSGEAAESICPKGWKLPTGNTNGQFYNVLNSLNSTTIQQDPYKFPAAGSINSDIQLYHPGTNGLYWSRTAQNADDAYRLIFNSLNFYPGTDNGARHRGFSVRCVADETVQPSAPLFTEEKDGNINVTIPSTLTIDATSGMAENADSSKIAEGTATATVSSNADYTVTLHSTQPALKDSTVTTAEISPVSETNPVQPGNNSWGFWSNKTNADDGKIYDTPITTTPQEFYNTTTSSVTDNGNTTTHTYYVGISIAPSLPSGTYSTDVTITAATK